MKAFKTFGCCIFIFSLIISCKKERSCEDCATKNNKPPIAVAGPDQTITLPTDSILLNGSSSNDPDGMIRSYLWTKISGPSSFSIVKPIDSITKLKTLVAGTYQFELKVTDSGGLSAKDTMMVLVNSSAIDPSVVNAGPDIIITLPLDSAYLGWWIISPPAIYEWSQVSGPSIATVINSALLSSLNLNIALVKQLIPGLYSFQLQAVNSGGVSFDTINVLVVNDPQDLNTITFKNLKWILADEYGSGFIELSLRLPAVPNLFFQSAAGMAWQLIASEIYLQTDPATQWINLNVYVSQPGLPYYPYDTAMPNVWIMRIPFDGTWVGKESNVKIKLL